LGKKKDIVQVILGGCNVSDSEAVKQMVPSKATISLQFIKHIYGYSHWALTVIQCYISVHRILHGALWKQITSFCLS